MTKDSADDLVKKLRKGREEYTSYPNSKLRKIPPTALELQAADMIEALTHPSPIAAREGQDTDATRAARLIQHSLDLGRRP